MKKNKLLMVFVSVALILNACNLVSMTPTPPPLIPVTGPIGILRAEKTLVESGRSDVSLKQVVNTADFYDSDTVRVTNGGTAKLDIPTGRPDYKISLSISNNTALDNVILDPTGTTDPFLSLLLVLGGVTGEVPKNGGMSAQFRTPTGVTIFILGTQFLVGYDPETGTTYIGNFDGTVAYSLPGQSVQFTQAGQKYEISSNFETKQSPLAFTRNETHTLTLNRGSTLLDTLKEFSGPTLTPTPTPTTTSTFFPTSSSTLTPTPTKITPCDAAAFVADITVPDGTSFSPNTPFTKVWRIRNAGTCTWTNAYSFVFYRGDLMGGPAFINLSSSVAPGQTVDISLGLVAPSLPGSYRGDWMLRNPSGTSFGAGVNGTTPLWVKISVTQPTTMTGKDGMTLLYVPAGAFTMGSEGGNDDEKPIHTVYLDAFWIDQTEVTNAMYAKCVADGKCNQLHHSNNNYFSSQYALHPVVYVNWNMARTYCEWAERRLPTESEWEKAARGTNGRTYPWGEGIDGTFANYDNIIGDTTPVGNYPKGASPYGALGMAGNVLEWVEDWYDAYPGNTISDTSYGTTYRVLRGGAWDYVDYHLRSAYRDWNLPSHLYVDVGFRCARSSP
jgi:formylglycine-generating enzyme required for sulfatase activity